MRTCKFGVISTMPPAKLRLNCKPEACRFTTADYCIDPDRIGPTARDEDLPCTTCLRNLAGRTRQNRSRLMCYCEDGNTMAASNLECMKAWSTRTVIALMAISAVTLMADEPSTADQLPPEILRQSTPEGIEFGLWNRIGNGPARSVCPRRDNRVYTRESVLPSVRQRAWRTRLGLCVDRSSVPWNSDQGR